MDALNNYLSGVKLIPLKVIEDSRGDILHMIRSDSDYFLGFGEAYFSTIKFALAGKRKSEFYHLVIFG